MSKQHELTAIIYDKRGRVLSIGKNSFIKTHPLQKKLAKKVGLPEKEFIHAEVAAIVRCSDLSKAASIKIFRFDSSGSPVLAKPCPICQSAIKSAGIKHIFHT